MARRSAPAAPSVARPVRAPTRPRASGLASAGFAAATLLLASGWIASPAVGQSPQDGWDVTAQHGPAETVRFTTDEGTWMTVDVSPDGRTLVFDLMGDLYTMPVEGGTATRITGGPAYDVQPRFSPDGSAIAFTSDRDGGDNLWIVDADGTNPRQVSDESYRLVNGPAWTPDGEYLLGRKHFTDTRSLGAGEVWMYHVTGGSGMRLTERRNDQQDQGNEIALSPDGRYVYFSEDVTPGPIFRYDKDPNPGIYAIRRLDRETGDVETVTGGPGGAARPVPSPDGERLAFVKRVRGESVLYVRELDTGIERPIWDGLDQDQQEAWAIFGVYPSFDWSPSGDALYVWGAGKIWRVDPETREATVVPFEAEVEQLVHESLRVPVDVHPERFEARLVSGAATSPDGGTLVFHAVGYLWTKALPDGTPERLTDGAFFEYDPAVSPDGRTVAFTTFDDRELGAVWTVPIGGGTPTRVTTEPGYYHEPRFSPDGDMLVFRKGSGNSIVGTLYGEDTGIFLSGVDGSGLRKLRDSGSDARFDHTGERVYFQSGGGLSKEYRSVDLHDADERTHFTLTYGQNVTPSPDGEWVAWNELFDVYVAPFPRAGGPVALSRDMGAVPVTKVTRDAGTSVHWSADSGTLHWMFGPEYFSRDLTRTFAFLPGAPDEIPPPDTVGVDVGLVVESDVPDGAFALVGARVITMRGDEVIEGGTVVVEGNRITAVGPDGEVDIPAGAERIDATGKTVIPGIIDVHAHASHFTDGPSPRQSWVYYANLAYGVTTAHDPSANTDFVFRQKELQRAGEIVGPRIFSTGAVLYGADSPNRAIVNSFEDAMSHIRRMDQVGAISVKSYNQPRREQRQQILQAARELGIMVVPEGGSTFYHDVAMILDGHTGIEHNIPVAPLYRDVMETWRHSDFGYTPTLVVNFGGPSGERFWYTSMPVWEEVRLLNVFPRPMLDAMSRRPTQVPLEEYHHITVAEQAKKLVDQGNTVQVGAHGQLQGLAAHWEMWMLEQGGMTPHEVLRAATLMGAQYLGMDAEIGSIEPGKLADLTVIDGNPLEDLQVSKEVSHVMVNGRLFDTGTMDEIAGLERRKYPFYWQREGQEDRFIWEGEGR